jgi:aryl-alcohol dehydrogenase-like predicted oxidoreductase
LQPVTAGTTKLDRLNENIAAAEIELDAEAVEASPASC